MKFSPTFLALVAAAHSAVAVPFLASTSSSVAPVPATSLVCDGNTYKCTASLNYGDGRWVAVWSTAVFHTALFGKPDHREAVLDMSMAPVPVRDMECDGNPYKCTASLINGPTHNDYGDGRWVAQWSVNVFHKGLIFGLPKQEATLDPVPAQDLTCDGNTYKCTANLDYGDGGWVAQWGSNVYHS